jgi:hypothetical protein
METCKKAIAMRRLRLLERDMRVSPVDAYMDCLDIVLSCVGDTDIQAVAESVLERICSLIELEAMQSKYEQSIQSY